jgi:hypothetical protein
MEPSWSSSSEDMAVMSTEVANDSETPDCLLDEAFFVLFVVLLPADSLDGGLNGRPRLDEVSAMVLVGGILRCERSSATRYASINFRNRVVASNPSRSLGARRAMSWTNQMRVMVWGTMHDVNNTRVMISGLSIRASKESISLCQFLWHC